MLDSASIARALDALSPDQSAVIRDMADLRGLDSDALTPAQYRALILEEAVFTLDCSTTNELPDAQRYAEALRVIAAMILT